MGREGRCGCDAAVHIGAICPSRFCRVLGSKEAFSLIVAQGRVGGGGGGRRRWDGVLVVGLEPREICPGVLLF